MKYARVDTYDKSKMNGVSPSNRSPWIRERFLYKVINFYDTAFEIEDDDGEIIYCLVRNCAHLGYGNWKIVEVNSR